MCGAKWSIYQPRSSGNPGEILHFGEKVMKLVSPLFVGVYLAEHYVDHSMQFFNIMNLIHAKITAFTT